MGEIDRKFNTESSNFHSFKCSWVKKNAQCRKVKTGRFLKYYLMAHRAQNWLIFLRKKSDFAR